MRSCCIFYLLKCEYKCCVKRNRIVNNPLKCPLVFGRNCGSGYPTPAARWWRWLTYCCITPFYSQFWKGEIPNALKSLAWQINRKCIGLNPVVMLQGREHADMCRGGPAAFHIFFNREKVKFWETPPIIFLFVRVIFTLSWHYKDDKSKWDGLFFIFQIRVWLWRAVSHSRWCQPPTTGHACHVSLSAFLMNAS